ncbi:MAG: SLOG family protein [Acutalibacter sp.]
MERETSCCFTGHRRIPEQDMLWLRRRLREEILTLAEEGVTTFLAGGALGFDTIAAQEVLRVRAQGLPMLKLVLALPYVGLEEQWTQRDAAVYRGLLRQADQVVYMAEGYRKGIMHLRDRYLVDHSAYCICYLVRKQGGTAYTAQYAKEQGVDVRNLAEPPWNGQRE